MERGARGEKGRHGRRTHDRRGAGVTRRAADFWSGVLSRQVLQHEVFSRLRTVTGVLYFEPAARTSIVLGARKKNPDGNCACVLISGRSESPRRGTGTRAVIADPIV